MGLCDVSAETILTRYSTVQLSPGLLSTSCCKFASSVASNRSTPWLRSPYVLITDTVVAGYHLKNFQEAFHSALSGKAARFLHLVIPPGETSKSRQGKADVEDFLLEHKCTRDTVVLALGGGVIGDLVGFVAATL